MFGLLVSMAVPLCGYFGATSQSQSLVCLFCGCNFCSAIFNVFGIITMTFFAAAITSGAPEIERGMKQCDPEICRRFPNVEDQIRCLATPIHEWHPARPIHPSLPPECPLFLICQKPTVDSANNHDFDTDFDADNIDFNSDYRSPQDNSYRGALLEAPDFYRHHDYHEATHHFAEWMKTFEVQFSLFHHDFQLRFRFHSTLDHHYLKT